MKRTDEPSSTTLNLVIHIDAERASALWHTACGARVIDQDGRFELMGGDVYTHSGESTWKGGTVMWCASALEAIVLSDYEAACGYDRQLLWDLAAGADDSGHVVLSSRAWSHS